MVQIYVRKYHDDLVSVQFSEEELTRHGIRPGDLVRIQVGGVVLEGEIRISSTSAPWLATRPVEGWDYRRITDLLADAGFGAGDDVQGDLVRLRGFLVGQEYTRKDIYDLFRVPADQQGGDWDTGYHKHGVDWFIFATVLAFAGLAFAFFANAFFF